MKEHPWENVWKNKTFEIKTLAPSVLVSKYQNELSSSDHILDVGCGNGRNSIYLARQGIRVDLFDVVDLIEWKSLTNETKDNLHFKQSTVLDYEYPTDKYKAVIVTRVIQYLQPEEVSFLLKKVADSLKPSGFLLLSYNTEGGIFSRKEIDVPKYVHKIENVEKLLNKYFEKVDINRGSSKSTYVNYSDTICTFDIYCSGVKK